MKTTAENAGVLTLFPEMELPVSLRSNEKSIKKAISSRSVNLPALLPICVLHASIENLKRISDEMPPEEYCAFIEDIWEKFETLCVKNQGFSQCGVLFSAVFFGDGGTAYLRNALNAGIEVRDMPGRFGVGSSTRRSVPEDFQFKVGLGFAEEYCAALKGSPDRVIMSTCIAAAEARNLSLYAGGGSLWASKNLLCRLSKEDRKSYRFGVRRGDDCNEQTFLRVKDPSSTPLSDDLFLQTAVIAAEIF